MAALVLSLAGSALGGVFGPVGAIAGRIAGAMIGNALDRSMFAAPQTSEGPRLKDLDVMASTEGAPIPRVYGRVRLSGQVIWATRFEEVVTTRTTTTGGAGGGKGGMMGGGASTTETTYSYFANFAVGLCEGEIGEIARIWADGKPLDLSGVTYRVYRGSATQMPDSLIVAREGATAAPAYRGLAYIVFERLALEAFGNRLPQLSFEIVRPVGALERRARAVTLIPGATEFGYEPATVVRVMGPGQSAVENRHVASAASDVMASLDALKAACPHVERVAVVVSWFGTDLRAGLCKVRPAIDNRIKQTAPMAWAVAGLTRADAPLVSMRDGRAAYGGTPSDMSVIHLLRELRARGLKVTLYPFLMMDVPPGNTLSDPWSGAPTQPAYPWRGRITCDPAPGRPGSPDGTPAAAAQVQSFFHGSGDGWSYRRMVLHCALLAQHAGGVDAVVVGSELAALTRVRSASGVYPAVTELAALAGEVKTILGAATRVTYAADWTEYGAHVVDAAAQEVRFPLDPLWASPAIDMIGIDYYAPLADWRDHAGHRDAALAQGPTDAGYLVANLRGGEAYDWYYADQAARDAQIRTPITDHLGKPWIYRAKDLWSFWREPHYERAGGVELTTPTPWRPQSKPIWFTELGCPAVDKGANQPNVFPDRHSAEGGVPHYSDGTRSDIAQRAFLDAVLGAFDPAGAQAATLNPLSTVYDGRMVDVSGIHLWTWDARPFPMFPAALDQWSDGAHWHTGHWLTGRLGGAPLADLVASILTDCGVSGSDTTRLGEGPDGYVIDRPMTARAMLEPLAATYGFDCHADGARLVFKPRGGMPQGVLEESDLVEPARGERWSITRAQETELPREVALTYSDSFADYRRAAVSSRRLEGRAQRAVHADLAIVTEAGAAQRRAEIRLRGLWAARESLQFAIGARHLALEPGDVVALTLGERQRLVEITDIVDAEGRQIKARSIDPDVFALALTPPSPRKPAVAGAIGPAHALALDLPALEASEPPAVAHLAVFATPWPGAMAVWASRDGSSFARIATIAAPALIGETLDALPAGPCGSWDHVHAVRVRLAGGALAGCEDMPVLDGANIAALGMPDGHWEIIQFGRADLVDDATYRLSRLLRGQLGSDAVMAAMLPAGAPFVVIDRHLAVIAAGVEAIGRPLQLRIVAAHRSHDDPSAVAMTITPQATALRPLSPVHLRARRRADGIHLSWIRRTRKDGDSWTGEVPLAEEREAYAVDILDATGAARRSIATSASAALYAAADELADFGAAQEAVRFRVAQLSSVAGAGFVAEARCPL